MIAANFPFARHHRTHRRVGSNKLCRHTFVALCSVLMVLIVDSQQKIASANAISTLAEAQQNQQKAQQQLKMVRKNTGGWVQTYKEPPKDDDDAPAEDDAAQGGRVEGAADGQPAGDGAEDDAPQEELSCTIKVHKVEKYTGKCVRLRGGPAACQTDTYLDPTSEDCMFLA